MFAIQAKIPIRRAVFHRGYDAAMILTNEFIAEYRARYGTTAANEIDDRMDEEKNRYNDKIIALIDEMGEASFLPQCRDYDFKYIPDELKARTVRVFYLYSL
jgi:hypothetical protein